MSDQKSFFVLFVRRECLREIHDQGHICILLELRRHLWLQGKETKKHKQHKHRGKHTDSCTDEGKGRILWQKGTCFFSFYILAYVVAQRCVCHCFSQTRSFLPPDNHNKMMSGPDQEVKKKKKKKKENKKSLYFFCKAFHDTFACRLLAEWVLLHFPCVELSQLPKNG